MPRRRECAHIAHHAGSGGEDGGGRRTWVAPIAAFPSSMNCIRICRRAATGDGTRAPPVRCVVDRTIQETHMCFGRGLLLWLLGVPIPIIILLALFWHS